MKKITILLSSVLMVSASYAQIFSDDFESYNNGDYVGPASTEWTTWSGAEGGAEDVQVTNAQASSGSNSIYFSSVAANGGPQDVILDFGQEFNSGVFTFETDIYVVAGKNAYFNFQATSTPGTTWAMNMNMANGVLRIDDGVTGNLAVTDYIDETWHTLEIVANLSTGRWQASLDGVCFGVWANSVNSVASLDLFPLNGGAYYIDDISFDHTTYTPVALNAAVSAFSLGGGNIVGNNARPNVMVTNAGTDPITSFDVNVNIYGLQWTENVTGVNLTAGQSYAIDFGQVTPIQAGVNSASATVFNVNGGTDGDATDDDACLISNPVVPAPGKVVVGEEATGTWCSWCVRGIVFMDQYEEDFGPYWAGIAVHNGVNDPMVDADYDADINPFISGYPSSLVDRGPEVDPSAMSDDFYTRLQTPPTAILSNASVWNSGTRELQVTVSADFQMAANNNYKLACVLTEDGVSGTLAGYAQANAYAGGGNGPMGGYENLPSPVPASQMVYDHVAREIQPSFAGDPNSFPATVNAGEIHDLVFNFTLPAEWNENNIHIISLLIAPNGSVDNAGKSIIGSDTGINEIEKQATFRMYPNPSSDVSFVEANFDNSQVEISLIDLAGKEVATRHYGVVATGTKLPINTASLESGVYIVELIVNGTIMTQRLIVE